MATVSSDKMLLSVREAAAALGISDRALWSITAPRGDVPCVRIGARVLYPTEGLRAWIAQHSQQAGAAEGAGE